MSSPPNIQPASAAFAVFFSGFVALGSWGLRAVQYNPRLTELGPFSSMDSDLASSARLARGSAQLGACFKLLRTERPVSVVFRGDSSADEMVGQITSVLGWPRQVWLVPVSKENVGAVVDKALKRDPEGIFFVGVPPLSSLGTAIEVGGGIVFVRREEQLR